jgi:hypothetical protein
MLAHELRRLNYIIVEGKIHKIVSIDENKIGTKRHDQISDFPIYKNYLDASWVEPIPLTEEMLLKCGFVKDITSIKLSCNNINLNIRYDSNSIRIGFGDYYRLKHIKYLHQLQNLYFALTNEELQIEL